MKLKYSVLSFIIFLAPFALFSQTTTRFFIERNFGLDIDTNEFKLFNEYSNTVYNTHVYDFKYYINDTDYIYLASFEESLPFTCNDSIVHDYVSSLIKKINTDGLNDSVDATSSEIRVHNSYSYFIISGKVKSTPEKSSNSLCGLRCYNNIVFKFVCSPANGAIVDDEKLIKVFKKISEGVTYYSDEQINEADSIAMLDVTPAIEIIDPINFKGNIWLKGVKPHKIVEALFEIENKSYQRAFRNNGNNSVEFDFTPFPSGSQGDKPTGVGYFILKNKYGKDLRFEFDFSKEFNR